MKSFILSIFGPKSGVGKTTFAANLALSLARTSKGKVMLLDMDAHDCGDLAILLGLPSALPLSELATKLHLMTPIEFNQAFTAYSDKVSLVPAFRHPDKLSGLSPDHVETYLGILENQFQYIIADCGSSIEPQNLPILEHSSMVLFCTTPEILALNRSVHSLNEFQSLAFPSDLVQIIVNQFDPKSPISETIIRQKLKKDCLALLPQEVEGMNQAVNKGTPIFQMDPRSTYSQVIDKLTSHLTSKNILKPIALDEAPLSKDGTLILKLGDKANASSEQVDQVSQDDLDRLEDVKRKIHNRLIEVMDFRRFSTEELSKQDQKTLEDLRSKTREAILNILDQMGGIKGRDERQQIVKEVLDEALALGPLEDLLSNPDISEILVNRRDQIFVEKSGRLTKTRLRFTTDKQLLGVIERIVAPIGRRIDEKTPMVDARLKDGSRVHAIIPPLAIDGPMLTIRKFSRTILSPDHLIKMGALTEDIADFLRACVQSRLNIIISGGTGTGKTTLLNVLSRFIPSQERILTVEDSAELQLSQDHVGRLEARPPNLQGEGAIPIRELVRNTLRMRPDRILVGECRGAEALDMLQAMNTGHDGSMTTIHANNARDCVSRLETLVMFAGMDLPSKAIREQIASAIQLIVQLSRLSDGTRKITGVTEVCGIEENQIILQDIFRFRERGLDSENKVIGSFQATGIVPLFADRFRRKGVQMPRILSGSKS
ncbi:MAG: Flp pilus assembly complex ATPase component TadA [Bdellovibrionales bacterium]|nr:Flp pilus assembly complex ATPase component TadA [Bdellovibrionales bacterium]